MADEKPDETSNKQWYIVHTYSGFEKKVADSLKQRVQAYGLQNDIGEVLIPTEDVVEMRAGKKVVTPKRFFPGYILVEMTMSDHATISSSPSTFGPKGRTIFTIPADSNAASIFGTVSRPMRESSCSA